MRNRLSLLLLLVLPVYPALSQSTENSTKACADLARISLPNAKVTQAQVVAASTFIPPGLKAGEKVPSLYKTVPGFCRVIVKSMPTADSDITIEVWMPSVGWNGKFRGQGNGGFAGYIDYAGLGTAVAQGYASASTDTGHATTDASWALGHPEKVVDYGYRGVHEMTVDAKSVVQAFYGAAPKQSYFASCSNGGRQALMEAQRFPDDYDGIVAGAPANNWTPMLSGGLRVLQSTEHGGYIPPTKVPAIGKAVIAACDAQDGVADGVLNDPRQCHFDPDVLLCKDADSDNCLTAPQVSSLKMIYSGAHDSSGHLIFPGLLPGAEEGRGGWATWVTGPELNKSSGAFFANGYFGNMVYGASDWDYKSANVDDAVRRAESKTGAALDAVNPDLKPFLSRGGKLILYHGWNDPAISSLNSINYYNSVIDTVGSDKVASSIRMYMVPGMQHCGGGPGATSFGQGDSDRRSDPQHDIFTALTQWVEKDTAPSTIIATKYVDDDRLKGVEMTRPLCVYPAAAEYSGHGDKNSATSFTCRPENTK